MEYRLKKRAYEEEEDELYKYRDKAVSSIEEVQERSHYYLKNYVSESEGLRQGFQQTEHLIEDVWESTKEELKKISKKVEDLDEDYYRRDRKSTRMNSSHVSKSYAVFCLIKKI